MQTMHTVWRDDFWLLKKEPPLVSRGKYILLVASDKEVDRKMLLLTALCLYYRCTNWRKSGGQRNAVMDLNSILLTFTKHKWKHNSTKKFSQLLQLHLQPRAVLNSHIRRALQNCCCLGDHQTSDWIYQPAVFPPFLRRKETFLLLRLSFSMPYWRTVIASAW